MTSSSSRSGRLPPHSGKGPPAFNRDEGAHQGDGGRLCGARRAEAVHETASDEQATFARGIVSQYPFASQPSEMHMNDHSITRRDLLAGSALCGGLVLSKGTQVLSCPLDEKQPQEPSLVHPGIISPRRLPDLAPAQWIWYPSGRTLQNTFILFRREVSLAARPRSAVGWIAADSRYRLEVNGQQLQFGPAPADPRWMEADPVDLTAVLREGRNVLGATVLYYGQGDGTCPLGKAGFLFWLQIEHADGHKETIVSDASWRALLCRAWQPGHYKRWYLRALQEEFDARHYPCGWSEPQYSPTKDWLAAMPMDGSPNKPALATTAYDYLLDLGTGPPESELRPRSIPLLHELPTPVQKLSESLWLEWVRPPQEYFEFRTPGSFQAIRRSSAAETAPAVWQVALDGERGAVLTFELAEQVVGWPYFTVQAPAGTVIELLVHEAHQVGGPPLLDTHFDSWTRFTCREGVNRFECFDFESLRWLQLHVDNARGVVTVHDVGVRRRQFPWPQEPRMSLRRTCTPAPLRRRDQHAPQCAQETLVDGMARERQQYSGDGGHQLHAVHLVFGEARLPRGS